MREQTISPGQRMTILVLVLFTLGTEVLPGGLSRAGAAAWICPAAAGLLLLPAVPAVQKRGLGDPLALWGPRGRRVWSGVFLVWAAVLAALQTARVGARLADTLGTSHGLAEGILLLTGAWLAAGGLPAFARACRIFLLAVGGAFLLLGVFGVFRLRWDYVLLWEGEDLARVPEGILFTMGLLAVGAYGLLFQHHIKEEDGGSPGGLPSLGKLWLALTAAVVLVLGRFGPALTGALREPFFQAASGLGFEGAFQRLEGLVSALWLMGDTALVAFLLLAMEELTGKRGGRWLPVPVLLLALTAERWTRGVGDGVLLAGTLLTGGLLILFSALKRELEKTSKKIEKGG